eukprot:scaffold1954_cov268-Pinguiococcus_pyrenoidosus.AAC.49
MDGAYQTAWMSHLASRERLFKDGPPPFSLRRSEVAQVVRRDLVDGVRQSSTSDLRAFLPPTSSAGACRDAPARALRHQGPAADAVRHSYVAPQEVLFFFEARCGSAGDFAGSAGGFAGFADGPAGFADGLAGFADGLAGFADGLAGFAHGLAGFADGLAGFADGLAGFAGHAGHPGHPVWPKKREFRMLRAAGKATQTGYTSPTPTLFPLLAPMNCSSMTSLALPASLVGTWGFGSHPDGHRVKGCFPRLYFWPAPGKGR